MDWKNFKIKKKFKKSEHQPNPDFYWQLLLFITSVLILLAVVFGLHLFFRVNQEDLTSNLEYQGQSQKISKTRIDKALQYFANRANKSETILNSVAPVADPSI